MAQTVLPRMVEDDVDVDVIVRNVIERLVDCGSVAARDVTAVRLVVSETISALFEQYATTEHIRPLA